MTLTQTVIEQLRAVCAAMRPAMLDDLGLHGALDALASEQGRRSGVTIAFDADPRATALDLPVEAELALYRAAQEAINNSLRHARPDNIHVSLNLQDGCVELMVEDDGRGFTAPYNLDSLAARGHLGLAGLRARVARLDGRLIVRSTPGQGTVVRVQMPLSLVTS